MKAASVKVRHYRAEDEPRVLETLSASLGGGPAGQRPPGFFRWKHFANPFGASYMLVAESEGHIAGVRAFMRWRWRAGSRSYSAVRAVDTATHPDFQGKGIFSKLTMRALEDLREEGVDFVFNTPNSSSLPGYLKMGWKMVGRVPIALRIGRPIRFLSRFRSETATPGPRPGVDAPPACEILDDPGLPPLLAEAALPDKRLRTPRDSGYLRWRYGDAPLLNYRVLAVRDGPRLTGVAIFRVRPRGGLWETTISELIVRPGDRSVARSLLRRVRAAAGVDHIACHFHASSSAARATRTAGFVRAPGGMTFVAHALRDGVVPDPTGMDSWDLSIGDLEVF